MEFLRKVNKVWYRGDRLIPAKQQPLHLSILIGVSFFFKNYEWNWEKRRIRGKRNRVRFIMHAKAIVPTLHLEHDMRMR